MKATSYDDINILLNSLLKEIKGVLGGKLVGLYLYGSLVWGDFDHDTSDIDLLAALSDDVDIKELALLEKMHAEFEEKNAYWDNRIEVQYFSLEGLKNFKTKRSSMATISSGDPLHIIQAGREYLPNWYFVQEYGITLYGPSPATLIDPISKDEFIESIRERAFAWREYVKGAEHSRPYQSYSILTMCRALYTLKNKEQVSKRKAALWVIKEVPEYAELIEKALIWRKDRNNNDIVHEETYPAALEFVHYMIDKIAKMDMGNE